MRSTLTLLLVIALTAPAVADDWPQSGKDAVGSSFSPETMGATFSAGWTLSMGKAPILTAPVLADGTLVVGDTAGKLQAVRALTGKPLWTVSARTGFSASPIVSRGRVFTVSLEGTLSAVRATDGRELWRQPLGAQAHGSPVLWNDDIVLSAGFPRSRVLRIASSDGRALWQTPPGTFKDFANATPIVWDDGIIAGDRGGHFRRIDPATGAVTSEIDAGGQVHSTRPLLMGGRVFLLTGGAIARISVLDPSTGDVSTTVGISDPDPPPANAGMSSRHVVSSPVALGDRVAFQVRFEYPVPGTAGQLTTYHLREWLFSFDTATRAVTPLAALGNLIVMNPNALPQLGICPVPAAFRSDQGLLLAAASSVQATLRVVDPASPGALWSSNLAGTSRAPITAANGQIFVATDAGVLHAFRSEVNLPPSAPVGLAPVGPQLDAGRPIVGWWATMDPEGQPATYEVRMDEDGEILETWRERLVTAAGVTRATFSTPLLDGRAYTFAARARDVSGAWSEWSVPQTFTAMAVPAIEIAGTKFDTIDAAIAAARSGDTITLGSGRLRLSAPLVLPAGVSLEGRSAHGTRLEASGLDAGVRINAGAALGIAPTIRGIEVSGATHGIEIAGARGVTVRNVVLRDNKESGLRVTEDAEVTLVNATVVGNGIGVRALGKTHVRNSILNGNGKGLSAGVPGALVSSYNDLFANTVAAYDGVERGKGDLAISVVFVNAADGNFLIGAAQPSTDRGDPGDDFSAEPAPNGGRVNLGAFGNTAEAEPSASTGSDCGCSLGNDRATAGIWLAVLFGFALAFRRGRRTVRRSGRGGLGR